MMNTDFEIFNAAIRWFNVKKEPVAVREISTFTLDTEFTKKFPAMTDLIRKSRKTQVHFKNKQYILFSWDTKTGISCGWLNNFEHLNNNDLNICENHQILLRNIGGIEETYYQPESAHINNVAYNYTFTMNQNFLFTKSSCKIGLEEWYKPYEEACLFGDEKPLDTTNYITFALEASGNMVLYNTKNETVLYYAPDHCLNYLTPLPGQPKFTFYTINGVHTFTDYVETLAQQWLDWVV